MKPATIKDVAARAGVSVASVSRVLNDQGVVAEDTRSRVTEAVNALSYVPHSGARSLITRRTDTVGVILPDLFGEFFSELIRGLDLAAREKRLHLIVSSSHDDADEASFAIKSMRGRVDGLIILSPHLDAAALAASLPKSLPVLLMNGGARDAERPSITVDNHGGARAMTRHLLDQGRGRVAHVAGPGGNLEAEARRTGYLAAMTEAGIEPVVLDGDFHQASGYRAGAAIAAMTPRPDAVFAGNDMMALGVLMALQEAGLRCPQDVAVGGFDDVPISSLVRPALTTMRIDIAGTGRRALERLVSIIGDAGESSPAHEIVRPELVVRESSSSNSGECGVKAVPAQGG
ncbi:MAG: LacI family DNA-binding transcriptional regulator [Brevundimonas sp.]|uniref:LacI family DNA-binding transcriptional regulator n=1 Tax=Brevundimonas sp. TaxID=1871086 RepID=UPI00391B3CA4